MDKISSENSRAFEDITRQMVQDAGADGNPVEPGGRLPSVDELDRTVSLVKRIVFPAYFDSERPETPSLRLYRAGLDIDRLYTMLAAQIRRGMRMDAGAPLRSEPDICRAAAEAASGLIAFLPELRRRLLTDVEAVYHVDPAAGSRGEIIFCYPGLQAMLNYRMAHRLVELGVPMIPRIIAELAHSATGIDIHPGAAIGEYFAIDHGTGIVIGETCVIGRHVTVYQGVTLGARNFSEDAHGERINSPRHPIIEDNVTIYSNASVLGRITIGHDAVIGATCG